MVKLIAFTAEGLEKVKREKAILQSKRPEAVKNLTAAREMGDLSENAAYRVARAKLSSLDSRLRYLSRLILLGRVGKPPAGGEIGIGSRVRLQQNGKHFDYKLVGSFESDPSKGKISHVSPIGKALMGKRPGETITLVSPSGKTSYEIIAVD